MEKTIKIETEWKKRKFLTKKSIVLSKITLPRGTEGSIKKLSGADQEILKVTPLPWELKLHLG